MRADGEIRHFESQQQAEAEGFTTLLTPAQAELLGKLKPEERQVALAKLRHQQYLAEKAGAMFGLQGRWARRVGGRALSAPDSKPSVPGRVKAEQELRRKRNKAARRARKRNRRAR